MAVVVITHNLKVKRVVTVLCLIHQNSAQHMVKNVSIVIRQVTMANAVIQTSRTILEDTEVDHEGDTMVVVDDPIKIFMMLTNRTVIATYMIQSLISKVHFMTNAFNNVNKMYCLMKSLVRCRLNINIF